MLEEKVQEKLKNLENGVVLENRSNQGEGSQSEWSEDEEGGASEPLLNDRESTGYTTDDPALENISMLNETGLTDAEGKKLTTTNKFFLFYKALYLLFSCALLLL